DVGPAVVGAGVHERRDAAADRADVAEQHAARVAVEPVLAVDADRRRHRLVAHLPQAGPDVGQPAHTVLEAAVGAADEFAVEPGAGHHAEVLAVYLPQ